MTITCRDSRIASYRTLNTLALFGDSYGHW